jgi:hypothetical protein
MAAVHVEDRGGHTVVVKAARTPAQRSALQVEADLLAAFTHPGCIELIGHETGDDQDQLVSMHAGSVTLADHRPASLGVAAGLLASVAGIVDDLHRGGHIHGNLAPDHVILGQSRHPVLCSFGVTSAISSDGRQGDLDAFAELIDDLASKTEPSPSGRLGRRQLRGLAEAAQRCRAGADLASVGALLAAVPEAQSNADTQPAGVAESEPDVEGTRTWRDRVPPRKLSARAGRTTIVTGSVAVAAIVALGMVSMSQDTHPGVGVNEGSGADLAAPEQATSTRSPGTVVQAASIPSDAPADLGNQCLPSEPIGIDLDGDGCGDPDSALIADVETVANLVRVRETWFEAGTPGDLAFVDDWNCNGLATVALVRPASGAVFVFDSWAAADASLDVAPITYVIGASGLERGRATGGNCPAVHVLRGDAAPTVLPGLGPS